MRKQPLWKSVRAEPVEAARYIETLQLQLRACPGTSEAGGERAWVLTMTTLASKHCSPGGQATALSEADIKDNLGALNGWIHIGNEIRKSFAFKNYYETMAFVNASAWVSHREDHHPDMSVHYNKCVVAYSTHDAGGITLNDFICAAKLDALLSH